MSSAASIHAFFGPSSPWAYLGAERLYTLADRYGIPLILRPIRVIQENGGIPLRTRPQPRQDYHAIELDRWSKHLGIKLNLVPKHYPCRTIEIAAGVIIAAQREKLDARALSFAMQRALWAEDRDIADPDTLRTIARTTIGAAGGELVAEPLPADIQTIWDGNLAEAQRTGVFGTPTYVYGNELFWGQERLEFLEQAVTTTQQ